jgi:hypothetical protein
MVAEGPSVLKASEPIQQVQRGRAGHRGSVEGRLALRNLVQDVADGQNPGRLAVLVKDEGQLASIARLRASSSGSSADGWGVPNPAERNTIAATRVNDAAPVPAPG